MASYYDEAELGRKLQQLIAAVPQKAWMLEVFSVVNENITAFPPLAGEEQRFVTDFFYPH